MPHRPDGQASAALSPGGVVNASVYTPPRVAGSAAAAIMRQQTSDNMSTISHKSAASGLPYGTHSSGVVTPVIKNKGSLPWLSASNKSSDSMDRSTVTTATVDDSRSITTMGTEDEREATASALLMVAKAAEREHQQYYLKGMVVDSARIGDNMSTGVLPSVFSASMCSASTVPLKKRKKQTDILRRQQLQTEVDKEACHVSPVSHDSSNPSSASTRTQSYDSKDLGPSSMSLAKRETTQELLDSSKVHSTAQIGAEGALPVAQVLIPHFPTVLHKVLADKDLVTDSKGAVIRWLPDGEAWKVDNWNAMRRKVLPKYFSDLRDENGAACGTIDAFLHNIDAWGFEEMKKGPNAGAYRHNLFIRGAQKLCVKMRFNAGLNSDDDNNAKKSPKTISPGRNVAGETDRMMLQVPMLAAADTKKQPSMPSNKRPRFENNMIGMSGHGPLHWASSNESASGVIWGHGSQFNPHNDMNNARAFGMRMAVPMNGSNPYNSQNGVSFNLDPRMQFMRAESLPMSQQQPPFQYNPPQVRSGRGALRGIASATQQSRGSLVPSPSTIPSFRHGFPVSNRGKGSRKSAACRTVLPTSSFERKQETGSLSATSSTNNANSMVGGISMDEAQRIGTLVKGGVAVAISRKTKRKLPMAGAKRSSVGDPNAATSVLESGAATVKSSQTAV